jgi:hypothetical protein
MFRLSAHRPNRPTTRESEVEFGIAMAQQGLWQEALFRFERAGF